jgi:hypothetical protein
MALEKEPLCLKRSKERGEQEEEMDRRKKRTAQLPSSPSPHARRAKDVYPSSMYIMYLFLSRIYCLYLFP